MVFNMQNLRKQIEKLKLEVTALEAQGLVLTKIKHDLKEIEEDMNTPSYFNPTLLDLKTERAEISADLD